MPWTSTDTGPIPYLGGGEDTQPVPAFGPGDGSAIDGWPGTTEAHSAIPPIGAISPSTATKASVVGATLDDLPLTALWRPRRYLLAVNQSGGRGLAWLGLVTITYAGVVAGALTVGPILHGAAAFSLVAIGIGLGLIDLVGVFVLAAMGDPRPTSRTYMERHLAARRVVVRSNDGT